MTVLDPRATATVVGGGPAGLMAAEVLARAGCLVTVYDHKPSVAWKFLLAGKGGLNITHNEPLEAFVSRYGPAQPLMTRVLEGFGPTELRSWCADLGEQTFVGSSGRVFPHSHRSTPLLRAWLTRLSDLGVEFRLRHSWLGFGAGTPSTSLFARSDGSTVEATADVSLLALGGASWPRTGSTASWVEPFESAGIEVSPLEPANCGVRVAWTPQFLARFAGQPIKNVAVVMDGDRVRGDCVVTSSGLEGGPVYAHSRAVRGRLAQSETATMTIDLKPDLSLEQLGARLAKKRPKESTSTWLRKAGFGPIEGGLLREATGNTIPEMPTDVAELAKAVSLAVYGVMPIERAISTAGGVRLDEIDDNFMLRKLPGIFVAGEMLDWEAPTGGYLLQGCFSTAVAAAEGAVAHQQA